MDTREFGLVAVHKLTASDHLHYGYWEEGQAASLETMLAAQCRYAERFRACVEQAVGEDRGVKMLDVGCGTGAMLATLLARGYRVDGVIPSEYLQRLTRERITGLGVEYQPTIYNCRFEDLDPARTDAVYGLIYFSESFQYIKQRMSLPRLAAMLSAGGKVVICDFFMSEDYCAGKFTSRAFKGGGSILEFYTLVEENGFEVVRDEDITARVSPSIDVMNDILMNRVQPSFQAFDQWMRHRNRFLYRLAISLLSRKLDKARRKYFSGDRTAEVFEQTKTYRLIVLNKR